MAYELHRRIFTLVQPSRVIFGYGVVKQVGTEAKALVSGRKAQIITDSGIVKAGIVDQVVGSLKEAGFEVQIWDGVVVEPVEKILKRVIKPLKILMQIYSLVLAVVAL